MGVGATRFTVSLFSRVPAAVRGVCISSGVALAVAATRRRLLGVRASSSLYANDEACFVMIFSGDLICSIASAFGGVSGIVVRAGSRGRNGLDGLEWTDGFDGGRLL